MRPFVGSACEILESVLAKEVHVGPVRLSDVPDTGGGVTAIVGVTGAGSGSVLFGMSRETALKSVTINGAIMMDLQDRVGSLEVGKDADFIVLSGDPFSVYTKVMQTWVEGRKRFDRDNPEDRLYATGGYCTKYKCNNAPNGLGICLADRLYCSGIRDTVCLRSSTIHPWASAVPPS